MAEINAALVGLLGVMAGGYFNNFLAEDYKRFRDSQALAGALAGELKSHASAIPLLKNILAALHARAKTGAELSMRETPEPPSPLFEANVEKIGLLGPELANGVAFVYEQIRAFRICMQLLAKHSNEESADWRATLIENAYERIKCAEERGVPLIENLKRHAAKSYWMRPSTLKQCAVGLACIAALVGATVRYGSAPERGQQCTTTLDQGALHTVCK
ncbi:hypothetical protein [Paraburkholderia fungorum]|uniref:Uncharacterized protein n=1 Tax=Paraburkholderia fungorum TaxID=134537 RepID=A0AAW3UYL0_9BURK|nr:hypothetical protein [Paraburkholderia fungorum]MBB4515830.1 hypothetical protein [Paraburkholderia fungorum]MBB6203754.1 hypothetical protein [Paraburkholderia fungorum]